MWRVHAMLAHDLIEERQRDADRRRRAGLARRRTGRTTAVEVPHLTTHLRALLTRQD